MCYLVCDKIGTASFNRLTKTVTPSNQKHIILEPSLILNLSTYYYMEGKTKQSLDILDRGITLYTNLDSFIIQKCKILILEHDYEQATKTLDKLLNQMTPYALFERAKLSMLTHHEENARYYVEKLLTKVHSKENVYACLIFFFTEMHNIKCAEECWSKVYKNPQFSNHNKLTQVAFNYERGNYEEAYNTCKELYKKQPDHLIICLYLAALSIALKKLKMSNNVIKHLKKLHPSNLITSRLETELLNLRLES